MVRDLLASPTYGADIDPERVYVLGTSMGGSGTLSMATRYPNVFAAAYADLPMTDYATSGTAGGTDWSDVLIKSWGEIADDNPIALGSPAGEADPLDPYSGTGVWSWQDHQQQLLLRRGDPMVPFGIGHGLLDTIIHWDTQGQPVYAPLNGSAQTWAGVVQNIEHTTTAFEGLPPTMRKVGNLPFGGWTVVRSETVPGLANASGDGPLPPTGVAEYNLAVEWSASWFSWDQAPKDEEDLWGLSLRTNDGSTQTVDVTARRVQTFEIVPGAAYSWVNKELPGNVLIDAGTVIADADGLLTIPAFQVTPAGNRLAVRKLLTPDVGTISEAVGGSQTFAIDAGPEHGGSLYWVLGTASGTSPGLPAGSFTLPLNADAWFGFTLSAPNTPVLATSFDFLDVDGDATSVLTLPGGLGAGIVGLTLHHACLLLDLGGQVLAVSQAAALEITP